jgi:hypothetical protein
VIQLTPFEIFLAELDGTDATVESRADYVNE